MSGIVLNVDVRTRTGTGGARDARNRGKVPGVLYGGALGPVAIEISTPVFRKALISGKFLGHMVTLEHKGETQTVIPRDVQFHPVSDIPMHVDLYRVDENQQVRVSVTAKFVHHEQSPGLKQGGVLNIVRHDVELLAPAGSIPEELVFDLTGLNIGDSIRISSITLPKGVTPGVDRDFVIATVAGSSASASEAAGAEPAAAE